MEMEMDPQLHAILYGHGVRCPNEAGLALFVGAPPTGPANPRNLPPRRHRDVVPSRPRREGINLDEDPIHERPSW